VSELVRAKKSEHANEEDREFGGVRSLSLSWRDGN